jgi:DNA-binding NarL/FixJ family response regulator
VSGNRLRVVVVDDQTSVRDGLVALLSTVPELDVVGSAGDGASALELIEAVAPDAVLMDLRMPGLGGVEATELLARDHPDVAVVVLTTFADDDSVLAALGAGARGYLTKNATRADMIRALQAAVADQVTLDRAVQRSLVSAAARAQPSGGYWAPPPGGWPDRLTEREGEILALIGSGLSNRDIADRLLIGNATVKTHVNRIFAKIGATDRGSAVAYVKRLREGGEADRT